MTTIEPESIPERPELRRDVTVWGSYMWGFADVGADTYVALGLVIAWTAGAAPLAFGLAGLVYIMVGLAYTELAAAYPVAGGGQYFTLRGLGDFWGFVAGSALMLDYTIDIALFSLFCAGYLNFFVPLFGGPDVSQLVVSFGPIKNFNWFWCAETLTLIGALIVLNVRGIRESSLLNEIIGIFVILAESLIILLGFLFAFRPDLLSLQWSEWVAKPNLHHFMYGSSLAIISFVGLESISQAAQETRRPATIVPRTSIALIFSVFIFAVSFSTLAIGVELPREILPASHHLVQHGKGLIPDGVADLPWEVVAAHLENPIAVVASALPLIGGFAAAFAAALGALMLLISANSGVMSVSRVTYSMSQFNFVSRWFRAVHPRYRTPVRTIWVFSLIGALQVILSFLSPSAPDTLANMYAFGASLGYTLVFIALMRLRFKDPYTPRPYKVPLNLRLKRRDGRTVQFPILGVIGLLGISTIFFLVVWTHTIGRIAGPAWVILCFCYYAWYRRSQKLPVLRSMPRNWEKEQMEVLESAEEYDLLEQYRVALAERDRRRGQASADQTR